jgi:hypothetical protein
MENGHDESALDEGSRTVRARQVRKLEANKGRLMGLINVTQVA